MTTRKRAGVCVATMLLTMAWGLQAAELDFNYVEANFINADVDLSETATDGVDTITLESDDDYGFQIGGAWQFYENWHVFGEYSQTDQDLSASGTVGGIGISGDGDFDVIRSRLGFGFGWPYNEMWNLYGRASWDYIEFKDVDIEGANVGDTDDSGFGVEAGARWMPADAFELQGYVRYTSVGDVDVTEDDEFDDDWLGGIQGRWYFTPNWAVQAGYEYGQISSWGAGIRFAF